MSNTSVASANSDLAIYNLSTIQISSASATDVVASSQRQSEASSPSLQRDVASSVKDTGAQMDSTPVTESSSLHSDSSPSVKGSSLSTIKVSSSGHGSGSKMASRALPDVHRQDSLEKLSSPIQSSSFSSQGSESELLDNSKCSSISEAHSVSPPKKPPRMLNTCTSERDVLDSVNVDSTLDFSNVQSDSQQGTNAFCEWDNCGNLDNGTKKEAKPSTINSNELLRNNCHLVQASLKEVPIYNIVHDSKKVEWELDSDEKQTTHQGEYLHESEDFLDNPATQKNSSSLDCPVDADDGKQKNSILNNPAELRNPNQPFHFDSVNQEKNSFQAYVELFTDSGPKQIEDSGDRTSDGGSKDPEGSQVVGGALLDTTKLDEGPLSSDKPILLPSVIAEVRLRSQASIAHNRYVFRSPSRSPTRKNDLDALNLLSFENTKFGSLQRKLRNSMRKGGGPRPKAVDFCPSSLKVFVSNEKEYNTNLAKLLCSRSSYNSDVEECFIAVRSIKSSSDSIIDYVSKHPLSVTTVIEAFYKQIEQFKHYATAGKELRTIEVASYEEEHRDLSNLLEKLVVVNDRLPFYCATFQSWLQLMPDEDNVDELRNLIDLLEQIRLNGLIPDSTQDTS